MDEPYNILGKSRFVSRLKSQPQPTCVNSPESEIYKEDPDTFAPEKQPREVLSLQESDSFFNQEPDISIPLEVETNETEPESDDAFDEEEDEELRQVLRDEVELASGVTFEQMNLAFDEINHSNGNNQAEAGEILYHMQDTEYISQLSAISSEKAERIKALIALHEQSMGVDTKAKNPTNSVDITSFLP
ncbi:MAG: hypothetical protein Q8861_00420 [Bacteroidota bacterium]|nr:hypothetical protein [Bacteroidota bacterium]MDP4268527.1 hypothetical protein [Bacteroidota bacterium]